jgi:4-amino-4-deoxy-L-arabinose transferase-like glycosyltransferase
LLIILLLAFGLRLHQLEGQSMWSDEGLSLYRARQPLSTVLASTIEVDGIVTQDTNPPLYFLMLHGWRSLVGEGIFVLRFAGVASALLAIPLIYLVGRLFFSPYAGLAAALFLAFSPFHVWQSQVLRNYGLLITLNLLSVYGLFRFMWESDARRWRWLLLWLIAGLAGIYTHYFGFFIFALAIVLLPYYLLGARREATVALLRRWWLWVIPLAGLLLLVPALLRALQRFQAGRQIDFYEVPVLEMLWRALDAYTLGMTPQALHPGWWVLPGLLLALFGLVQAWHRSRPAALLLLFYLFLPLALLLALSTINPIFNGARHLLMSLPPFLLLAGAGTVAVARRPAAGRHWSLRLGLALAALFLAFQVSWLYLQFNDHDFVRDDIRGAANYLETIVEGGDVVVLHDTLIKIIFDYYYDGAAPVVAVPQYGQQDEEAATVALQNLGQQYRRVWFLTQPAPRTGFPRDLLSTWARRNWRRFTQVDFRWMWLPVQLQGYTAQAVYNTLPPAVTPTDATFGDALRLHAVSLPQGVESGTPLQASFYFSKQQPLPSTYDVSLRLTDETGQLWQQIDRQLWPEYDPSDWPTAGIVRYDHLGQLHSGLQPGVYQLWLRVTDRETGQPLPVSDEAVDLRLSDIAVSASSCQPLQPGSELQAHGALFGAGLVLQGHSQPLDSYRPGHLLSLDLLWCVRRTPNVDYQVHLRLVDENGVALPGSVGTLGRVDYPPSRWQSGQQVLSKANLVIPAQADTGTYTLELSLVNPENNNPLVVNGLLNGRALSLFEVQVDGWPMETTLPPIPMPFRADFGDPAMIELHGYELPASQVAPGEQVDVTTFWRAASGNMDVYSIFLHLGHEGEPPIAQSDGGPVAGFRPTSGWREGEVIEDSRLLQIPAEVTPGTYRLSIGFYDPETGQRVPAFVDGERVPNDAVLLQRIQVEP